MKHIIRITAVTVLLFNVVHMFATWQTALMWSIPIGMLLFTAYDDAETRRYNAKTQNR